MMDWHLRRLVLNRTGLGKILKGEHGTVDDDLNRRGERVAKRANSAVNLSKKVQIRKGGLYEYEGFTGRRRYRTTIHSTEPVVVADSPLVRSVDAAKDGTL